MMAARRVVKVSRITKGSPQRSRGPQSGIRSSQTARLSISFLGYKYRHPGLRSRTRPARIVVNAARRPFRWRSASNKIDVAEFGMHEVPRGSLCAQCDLSGELKD